MIALLYAAVVLGQAVYWFLLQPETERLDALYFDACLLRVPAPEPQSIAVACKQQEHTVMQDLQRTNRRNSQRGFSLIELLVVVTILLILAAIMVPKLLQATAASKQSAAAQTLRAFNTAVQNHSARWNDGFPPPAVLTAAITNPATCASGIVDLDIAGGKVRNGYAYAYIPAQPGTFTAPAGCAAVGFTNYVITATPTDPSLNGYCIDTNNSIHVGIAAADAAACDALPTLSVN